MASRAFCSIGSWRVLWVGRKGQGWVRGHSRGQRSVQHLMHSHCLQGHEPVCAPNLSLRSSPQHGPITHPVSRPDPCPPHPSSISSPHTLSATSPLSLTLHYVPSSVAP